MAERYVPSSASALIIASVPLWVILLRAWSRERPAAITWVGVAFGLAGVVALVAVLGHDDPAPGLSGPHEGKIEADVEIEGVLNAVVGLRFGDFRKVA